MADAPHGVRELLHQNREEVSFRKALSNHIARAIADRNLPLSVRVYSIAVVATLVLISFTIAFLLICAIFKQPREIIFGCWLMFCALCGAIAIPGILLMMRLSSLEQAERLRSGFAVIEMKKKIRSRGHALAQPAP